MFTECCDEALQRKTKKKEPRKRKQKRLLNKNDYKMASSGETKKTRVKQENKRVNGLVHVGDPWSFSKT